jgi:hypothetical protein
MSSRKVAIRLAVCPADHPGDDRFRVACYHELLEAWLSRGRELRAPGLTVIPQGLEAPRIMRPATAPAQIRAVRAREESQR